MVGDSIIDALGKNANQLRLDLIALYPGHEFVNYNYGFGSTNILTVPDRLDHDTTYLGEKYPAINGQSFDLILIDSFGYNPLSQFPLQEGLKKQEETLDTTIKELSQSHPNSVIAIFVPMAPSIEHFGEGVLDLSPEARKQWAEERIAYLKNAIAYAQKRNLPLIDVYDKSLTADGKANLDYINHSDYIHPSEEGIKLISQTIADYIHDNKIFPE